MAKKQHPTRIFKDPKEMEAAWEGYKHDLKKQSQQWPKVQYVGKDGDERTSYPIVPQTIEGFKRYCYKKHGEIAQYLSNQDDYYPDFISISRAIKEEVRENQILGGMMGFYNPSITARLNGLAEKNENTTTNINTTFSEISEKEKRDLKADLESDL